MNILNNAKIAWRSLLKYKGYTALNILGLSIGIAGIVVLFQYVNYHLSFDNYHPRVEDLYRVVTDLHLPDGSIEYDQGAPVIIGQKLKSDLSVVENYGLLLANRSFTVSVNGVDHSNRKLLYEDKNVGFANSEWFDLFSYEWRTSQPSTILKEPNTAILTQKLAEKYFGNSDPIGRSILIENKHEVVVTGVIKNNSQNSDIRIDMFLSLATFRNVFPDINDPMFTSWDWVSSSTYLFALLSKNASLKQANSDLENLGIANMGEEMASVFRFRFQPLNEIHFDTRYDGVIKKSTLFSLGLVAFLLITVVCVNFINLATAQSVHRSREIGVRKVLGSSKLSLFLQHITETAMVTFFSFLLALLWMLLFLPYLNSWLQISLSISVITNPSLILVMLVFFVILIFGAGFYPAVVLARLKTLSALKNQLDRAQTVSIQRKFLIVTQNVIAQILIICTLVIALQLDYLMTTDLGFDTESIVIVDVPEQNKSKMEFLKNQLISNSKITDLSFCSKMPSDMGGGGTIKYNNGDWLDFVVRSRPADANYLKTFQLELIAGRNVVQSDTVREFIVNENLLQKLEIQDPQEIIGKSLVAGEFSEYPGKVVGVIKDFHSSYLYQPKEPLLITTLASQYNKLAIKVASKDLSEIIASIKSKWESTYDNNVFSYEFLSDHLGEVYKQEDVIGKLMWGSAIVAIILSCVGWLGLISLITAQRNKEIGVRKILGSSHFGIISMLSLDFLKLTGIAAIIAAPIAWYAMNRYLQGFAYGIDIQWWIFVVTALLSAIIVLLTIGYRTIKASQVNPIDILRLE